MGLPLRADREQFRGYEASLLVELARLSCWNTPDARATHCCHRLRVPLLEEDEDLAVGEFGIATRLVQAPQRQGQPLAAGLAEAPPPGAHAPTPPVGSRSLTLWSPILSRKPWTYPRRGADPPADRPAGRSWRHPRFEPPQADPAAVELTGIVPVPAPPPASGVADERGRALRFEIAGGVAVLGRTKDCEIAIPDDASISRRHAEIRPEHRILLDRRSRIHQRHRGQRQANLASGSSAVATGSPIEDRRHSSSSNSHDEALR